MVVVVVVRLVASESVKVARGHRESAHWERGVRDFRTWGLNNESCSCKKQVRLTLEPMLSSYVVENLLLYYTVTVAMRLQSDG